MLIDNKLSCLLSGPQLFLGLIFLTPGIWALIHLYWAIFVPALSISWFLYASYSGVQINTKEGVFREYNCWFGLFKTGQWKNIDNYLGLTLVPMKEVYRIYSQSNRATTSLKKSHHIYFVSQAKQPAISIKKCATRDKAQIAIDELAIWLKLPVFTARGKTTC